MPTSLTFFEVTGDFFAVADPSVSGVQNAPIVQPVSALVTFTPRLKSGQLLYVTDYLVTNAYNAEQTVNLLGNPTSGTWTLQYGTDITDPPLPWNATPAQVQAALTALPSIGAGNVIVVADVEPYAYDVEFTGALGNQQTPVLIGNADQLVNAEGPGFCEITVAPTAMGSPQVVADTAIAIGVRDARIWNGVLSTIDVNDTPGVQLPANTAALNLGADLIYDVAFSKVTYNGANQKIAPFAFKAPTDGTAVSITDPSLDMLPYVPPNEPPYSETWAPPGTTPLNVVYAHPQSGGWRERAGA